MISEKDLRFDICLTFPAEFKELREQLLTRFISFAPFARSIQSLVLLQS